LDQNIALFFWGFKDTFLYDIFNIISGKTYIIITCAPFIIIAFIKLKKRFLFYLLTAIIAFSVSDMLCYRVLKPSIKRLRPVYELKLTEETQADSRKIYSMPSNHASNIAAFFTVYFFLVRTYWTLLLANSILISLSRIITVNHYPTDVMAGMLAGLLIGGMAVYITSSLEKRYSSYG
jgi:undecaprenyl-diphosphatase